MLEACGTDVSVVRFRIYKKKKILRHPAVCGAASWETNFNISFELSIKRPIMKSKGGISYPLTPIKQLFIYLFIFLRIVESGGRLNATMCSSVCAGTPCTRTSRGASF